MKPYLKTNLERWNELVPIHAASRFYDVEGFKAGKNSLTPLERAELGDVAGKSLLHLQCHFGLDTLSWARLGARVTGLDFSDKAVELARSLAAETGIDARFACADVYNALDVIDERFDVVFTSHGALCWLSDLKRWAEIVAHCLKPGGTFYIAEIHPTAYLFDDAPGLVEFRLKYPYFSSGEPLELTSETTYTDGDAPLRNTTEYCWAHTLGDVVNALIRAGLRIEFLNEHRFCVYKAHSLLVQGEDGLWRLPDTPDALPFLFSIKATKP